MKENRKFAVLGAGNGGMALAGQIAAKGYSVNLFDGLEPTEAFLQLKNEKEIFIKGHIQSKGKLHLVSNDIEEAVKNVEVICIVVPAFAHEPIFEKLLPHLKDGHKIVLIPGNYGSILLKKMLADKGVKKEISISEVASLPYACRTTDYNTVMVHKQKLKLKLATCPIEQNNELLQIMNGIADIYISAENVLEVSMDNFNSILHPLPLLLNIGAIDKDPDNFSHYLDGITPFIAKNMRKMDQERLRIGKEYALNLISTLDQLKMYYGENDSIDIFQYVNSNESPYKKIIGHSVFSRYITEDIPYLVVPTMLLGEKIGIETPLLDICVKLASVLHGIDYIEKGYNLHKLGIAEMSKDELLTYISKI